MNAFIDTNVLMDCLDDRRENFEKAHCLLQAIKDKQIKAVISTQAIVDSAYLYTGPMKRSVPVFRLFVDKLFSFISVCEVTQSDIGFANKSSIPDYEDAVQVSCALRSGCDTILSGDRDFQKYTDIPVYSVPELFSKLFEE